MKRLLITIIAATLTLTVNAQRVEASHIFNGKQMRHQETSCTEGASLKPYNLTFFSTATTQDRRHFRDIEKVIESNESKAIDKECGYINGRLYYGFYQFKPDKEGRYRYIFYRNSSLREDEPCEITIVYMEGYPTLAELKKMFQK